MFCCGVSLGRMGGDGKKGRGRLGRTKLQEKNSGWTFSLTQSQVSQLCLGEKRRKLEKITAFGSPPSFFLSLNCDCGVFLLPLFIIFSTKIFGFFLWKQGNWLGRGRREMAAVPAHSPSWSQHSEQECWKEFLFFTRTYQVPAPKRVQEYQMKVSLITASMYKYQCLTLKIDSWVFPLLSLRLCA